METVSLDFVDLRASCGSELKIKYKYTVLELRLRGVMPLMLLIEITYPVFTVASSDSIAS